MSRKNNKKPSAPLAAAAALSLLPLLPLLLFLCTAATGAAAAASGPLQSAALETHRSVLLARPHHPHTTTTNNNKNCTLTPLIKRALDLSNERLERVSEQRRALERDGGVLGTALKAQRALEGALKSRRASVDAAETAHRAAAERGDWAASAELGDALEEARAAAGRAAATVADAYARRGQLAEVARALDAVEAEAEAEAADALDSAATEGEALAERLLSEAKDARLKAAERRERASARSKASKLRSWAASLRLSLSRAHELAERAAARAAQSAAESDARGRGLVASLAARDLAMGRASGVAAEASGAFVPVKEHAGLAAALGEYGEAEALRRAAADLEVAETKGAGATAALAVGAAEAERRAVEHAREHAARLARLRGAARTAERLLDLSREALGVEVA